MPNSAHSIKSSYREMLIEHLFAGEVMRHLWLRGITRLEVLKPQVDDGGYDMVLEAGQIVRHVQLKSSFRGSTVRRVNINASLAAKPSGCVVFLWFDQATLDLGPFGYFGGLPAKPLPALDRYRFARHTKADSTGVKKHRINTRCIPLTDFVRLNSLALLTEKLFGIMSSESAEF